MATATGIPLTCEADRPCAEIRRLRINRSSSIEPAQDRLRGRPGDAGSDTSKTAAALASSLPARIRSLDALPPRTRPRRGQQEALARTGLAGPGTIAGSEVDRGVLDQREVLNGEFAEHGSSSSGGGGIRSVRRWSSRRYLRCRSLHLSFRFLTWNAMASRTWRSQ